MFWRKKNRLGVATLLVAVDADAAAPVRDAILGATRRIVDAGGDFEVTKASLVTVVRTLLAHPLSFTHAASGGEVFDDDGAADDYGSSVFADLSTRYLAGGDQEPHPEAKAKVVGERVVCMLTVGYRGEAPALEQTIGDRIPLEDALTEVLALVDADRLELAHVHVSPARPDDHLDDERMLVAFPELMSL